MFIPPFVSCVALSVFFASLSRVSQAFSEYLSPSPLSHNRWLLSSTLSITEEGLDIISLWKLKHWKFLTTHLNFPVEIGQKSYPWYFPYCYPVCSSLVGLITWWGLLLIVSISSTFIQQNLNTSSSRRKWGLWELYTRMEYLWMRFVPLIKGPGELSYTLSAMEDTAGRVSMNQ